MQSSHSDDTFSETDWTPVKPRSLKSQATWLLQPHLPLSHMVWLFITGMILLFKDMFGLFKNIF